MPKKSSENPMYPSLKSHENSTLSHRYGMRFCTVLSGNKKSGAMRMFRIYRSEQQITIIGLKPHPEGKKNGA